ncbi:MAG: hypothetical protein ABI830_02985, partial [Pseudolabrys sp.]
MPPRLLRPTMSREFAACARAYALDLILALILFVVASIAAGRVWRFPFDDELLTFNVAERSQSAFEFLMFFLKGGDIHPPLAFIGFYGLLKLGFADWGLRLCSLALTGLALALFHSLCLMLIARRSGRPIRPASRFVAIVLFGLCPMAVSQGDAIRWYPAFAALVAVFVVLYIAGGNRAARLYSAVALGLAASTNFLAILVALPLLLYRRGLKRKPRPGFDIGYWLVVLLFASFGLVTAYSIAAYNFGAISGQQAGYRYVRVAAVNVLGFFGGDAVGIGYAWMVAPAAVIAAFSVVAALDRKQPNNPVHLLVLMLGAIPIMCFADFVTPRSFLYLAPVLVTLFVLFLNRQGIDRGAWRAVLPAGLLVAASVAAIANINHSDRPFKRNAAIPFQQIIDFIQANGNGRMLVVSSDPVLAWTLRHDRAQLNLCASYFLQAAECFERPYDSVFVVDGHSNRSGRGNFMQDYKAKLDRIVAAKSKIVSMPAGLDRDAALKQWLTGVPLDRYILT